MKKNTIDYDKILQELADCIPEVRKNSYYWKSFIMEFINARPDATMDANFKAELREEILRRSQAAKKRSSRFGFWKYFLPFGGGVAMTVLVVFTMLNQPYLWRDTPKNNPDQPPKTEENIESGVQIISDSENAFGTLSKPQVGEVGQGETLGLGGGEASMDRMIMPYPGGRINYQYVYEGDDLSSFITEKVVTVYKKDTESADYSAIVNALKSKGLPLVDLNTFGTLSLQNLSLNQKTEDGYVIAMDFQNQNLNIHQDYQFRPMEEPHKPFTKDDMPSDSKVIAAANQFIQTHKINLKDYGDPYVRKYWEENNEAHSSEYYPDSLPVIYPLVVETNEVRDQGNGKVGLTVNINVRDMKIENLHAPVYTLKSSKYEASTAEDLLAMAEDGGLQGVRYVNPEKTVELKLGNPEKALTQMYINNDNQRQEEYLVPALIFPVLEAEKSDEVQARIMPPRNPQKIIVPLAENLFSDQE